VMGPQDFLGVASLSFSRAAQQIQLYWMKQLPLLDARLAPSHAKYTSTCKWNLEARLHRV